LFADGFEELKAACALIDAGKGVEGTGYLVAPDVVVTCEHVIRGANRGDKVDVHLGVIFFPATLTEFDEQTDCAYLHTEGKNKGGNAASAGRRVPPEGRMGRIWLSGLAKARRCR